MEEQSVWLKQLCEGNESAYKVFFEEYYQVLGVFALKYVKERPIAEDIVNDVILELYTHKRNFNNILALKSFLYLSVKSRCFNHIRHSRAKEKYCQYSMKEEKESFFLDNILQEEVYLLLKAAITQLPGQTRKVYELSLEGLSNEAIAQELSLSVDSVKAYKKRGKQFLKDHLRGLMGILLCCVIFK